MTNHSYFNLEGDAGNNSGHLLMVDADYYTPVDSTFMTTGEIVPVEGTPMDFRTPTPVGERINVCLETQKYPDTPNKAEWPSAVLRPGEKYTSQCIFKFSVDK